MKKDKINFITVIIIMITIIQILMFKLLIDLMHLS
jgi:hypothetical protein